MAGIRERLVQLTVRARNFLAGDLKPGTDAMKALGEEGRRLRDVLAEAGRARGLVRTLRDTEGATGSLERAWRDAQATLDDLTREIGDNEQATAGQRIALREARRTADDAKSAYDRSQRAIKNLRTELKALNVDTDSLVSEEDRLTAEIKQNKQAVDDNREAIKQKRIEEKKAADAAKEHASRVDAARGALAAGAKQVVAFAAAFVGLNALFGVAGRGFELLRGGIVSMLQTGDQFEGLQTRMNALMGSVAAGEAATAWVKEFAKNTPLELQDVTDAFAQLQAYGVDPMSGTLQALVDQNEKLGGGMERLGGIIGAVGQAYAKQKLQTEEILQLVERGVPVWDMLSKVTGKSGDALQDLASKGKLGRDVLAALVKEIGRLSAGAAESNMDRLSGIISNLKDQLSDFYDRIANAGALEYVKGQFQQLSDTISQMAADGRLDKLAKGISDAFVQGAEWVKRFSRELLSVDFSKLSDDSSAWLSGFGAKLDSAAQSVQLFIAPFRTLLNGLTSGISSVGVAFTGTMGLMLSAMEAVAEKAPELLGGKQIHASVKAAREAVNAMRDGLVAQIEQDGQDIASAWDTSGQAGVAAQRAVADAAGESGEVVKAGMKLAETGVLSLNETLLNLVTSGKVGLADLAQAVDLIDAASAVQQLESMRAVLLDAFDAGKLSQQEYEQATGLLVSRLKELQGSATGAADGVSDLEEKLGDLQSVQQAISSAKTDVDINNIRAALRKLYNDGEISAAQYNEELKKTSDQQKELKGAVEQGAKAQRAKTEADKEAIVTSEDLRRASGKRMEEERRAIGENMEARRKGSEEVKQDSATVASYIDGVMARAREPLAQLSAAALEVFDRLRGLGTTQVTIDTSSLEQTAGSLERVSQQLQAVQAAASGPGLGAFSRWQLNTLTQSLRLQEATLGQKLQLQSLMQGYEDGSISLGVFVRRAQEARGSMALLDEADLSQLDSAIASAQQRMQQLGDASRSTLDGLRDELDRLQGNEEDIERRRYASRQRELQAQLAEAQGAGDAQSVADLTQALGVLRQIQTATEEQRAKQGLEKQNQAPAASAAPPAAQQPARIIRLETPRGRAVEVSVADAASETGLLDLLADAGLRTL